jgi:hypothetical protein
MTYADRKMQLDDGLSSRVFLLCEMKIPENRLYTSPAATRSAAREYRCSGPRLRVRSDRISGRRVNPGYIGSARAIRAQRGSRRPGSERVSTYV